MSETKSSEFWDGYEQAIEAVENRLLMLRATVNRNTRPMDFFLDLSKEIKELKNIHSPADLQDWTLPDESSNL